MVSQNIFFLLKKFFSIFWISVCLSKICLFFFFLLTFLHIPWYQHCFFQLNKKSKILSPLSLVFFLVGSLVVRLKFFNFLLLQSYFYMSSLLFYCLYLLITLLFQCFIPVQKVLVFFFCFIILDHCDGNIFLFPRSLCVIKCSLEIKLLFRPYQLFDQVLLFYLLLPVCTDGVKSSVCDRR